VRRSRCRESAAQSQMSGFLLIKSLKFYELERRMNQNFFSILEEN
jgi:hypothetical protein